MALSGARVVLESGADIPGDVAIASYEDSPLARTHRPSITAIGRSAVEYGRVAARRMLEIIAGWSTSGASETAQTESRAIDPERSEEHTSELQSRGHLVCRLLLEKKNT